MNLVWDGRRFVNLDYLITAEDANGTPPADEAPPHLDMHMETGVHLTCHGPAAAEILRVLRDLARRNAQGLTPGGPPQPVTVDPSNGSAVPVDDPRSESA